MDEILIEEKKYVSSKRAAKITGYAKDYIGQLCREGRVPARLVGRSWYVLESAIQDHRFGDQDHHGVDTNNTSSKSVLPETWETPRYESSVVETIPPINRLRDLPKEATDEVYIAEIKENSNEDDDRLKEVEVKEHDDVKDVPIQIHTTYTPPPEELLPKQDEGNRVDIQVPVRVSRSTYGQRPSIRIVTALATGLGVFIAGSFAVVAIINSGYFDTYVSKIDKASAVSGIILYDK